MKSKKNWLIPLVMIAAAGAAVLQNSLAPAPPTVVTGTAVSVNAPAVAFTDTPTPTLAYEGCAYTWAYHDAPKLTDKVGALIGALASKATASASLYGEDCVYADGRSIFGAMETDFYVRLPVDNLTDQKFLGDWMAQVMQIVVNIPREEIQGNYGFVEFWFEKGETEHIIVRVPIQKYKDEAQGKSGVELYKTFSAPP